MKTFKPLLLTLLCLFVINFSQAQDKPAAAPAPEKELSMGEIVEMTAGYIKMVVKEASSNDEQTEAMIQMLLGSATEYYFNSIYSLVKANIMGGMINMTSLFRNDDEHLTFLMDAMGQKMLVESTKAERAIEEVGNEQADFMKEMEIVYNPKDQKKILDFICIRADIIHPDTPDGVKFSMYVAQNIKASAKMIQGMQYFDIDGFPLEYIFDAGQMKLTIVAEEFQDEVDEKVFNISTSGYKKMTWSEFQETMGQFGGGLGGF